MQRRRLLSSIPSESESKRVDSNNSTSSSSNNNNDKRFQFGSTPVNVPLETTTHRKERPLFYRLVALALGCAAAAHVVVSFVIPVVESVAGGVMSRKWTVVEARVTSPIGAQHREITYEFTDAKGEKRVGNRFSFWFDDSVPVFMHVLAHGRKVGDDHFIDVRYSPSNPNRSVVRPGVGNDLWFPALLGVSMLFGCARLLRYGATRFPTKKRRLLW